MRQVFHPLPWLYPEDPPELRELYRKQGKLVAYKKGDIIKSGGESRKLFHLVSGLAAYYVNYSLGEPRSFALILPGRSMCDLSNITGQRVNVTTIVMRKSEVLVVPPNILVDAMEKDAALGVTVCRHAIAKQESSLEATITNFTQEPAMRLKILLKAILTEHYGQINEFNAVPIVLTNEEFAKIINVTRVTINRILSDWKRQRLISKNGKQIIARKALFADVYDWLN